MFPSFRLAPFALVAACLMLSALAAPKEEEKRATGISIPYMRQQCISIATPYPAGSKYASTYYDVRVGRENTAAKCNEAKSNFKASLTAATWSTGFIGGPGKDVQEFIVGCTAIENNYMRVQFYLKPGQEAKLNKALAKTFPAVNAASAFKC